MSDSTDKLPFRILVACVLKTGYAVVVASPADYSVVGGAAILKPDFAAVRSVLDWRQ